MKNPWIKTVAVVAGWVLLGFVLSLEVYFNARAGWGGAGFSEVAMPQFSRAAMWALMAPFILRLRDRMPLHAGHWLGGISYHLAMSFVVMAVFFLGRVAAIRWFNDEGLAEFWSTSLGYFYGRNIIDMAYYWSVLAFGYSLDLHRRFKNEELKAAQLEVRLVETELKALREQLRPHFLFNTLNTISVLVREGQNNSAVALLARLSSLLRMTLDGTRAEEVTVQQEVEFLTSYLEIQQARFPDRLRVTLAIDGDTLGARIPCLILQPLVENAVLHGVAPKSGPGEVTIRSRRSGDDLHLEVSDDGPGFHAGLAPKNFGVGLANIHERLEKIYGARGRLTLRSAPGLGALAQITIPCRL